MALIEKLLHGVVTFDANGKPTLRPVAATAVKSTDGKTLQQHIDDTSIHTSAADLGITMDTKLATAVGLLKDGADGSSLAEKYDNLKKLGLALDATDNMLTQFLEGEPDGGDIDRLKELLAEIAANRDSIDTLTSGKVNVSDIINDLVTGGTAKPLSAEQGKVLKGLIDTLRTEMDDAIAALHTHANLAVLDKIAASSVVDKGLTYNGNELNLAWRMEMTIAEAEALTGRPAGLHPMGEIFLIDNPVQP